MSTGGVTSERSRSLPEWRQPSGDAAAAWGACSWRPPLSTMLIHFSKSPRIGLAPVIHKMRLRVGEKRLAGLRPCQGEGAKLDFTLAESRSEFVPIEACRSFSVAPDLAFS